MSDQAAVGVVSLGRPSVDGTIVLCSAPHDTDLQDIVSSLHDCIFTVHTVHQLKQVLESRRCEVVLVDFDLPEFSSTELLTTLRLLDNEPDIVLISRCADRETVRRISESRRRYVLRDDRLAAALKGAVAELLRIRRLERAVEAVQVRLSEANQQLELRNQRLDEFCAMVAHDIRGPLAALVLRAEFLSDRCAPALEPRCAQLLNGMVASGQRLVEMVRGMYEFARLGAQAAQAGYLELATVVREVLEDLHLGEGVDVVVQVEAPPVWGDPELLRRVFGNLISNAAKYSDKSPTSITIRYSGLLERSGVPFGVFVVEDNGRGIAQPDLKRIFGIFQRGMAERAGHDGLGIGLAVVQRVVELHGGCVAVHSELGVGTRISVQLPFAPHSGPNLAEHSASLFGEYQQHGTEEPAPSSGNSAKDDPVQGGQLSEQDRSRRHHQIEKICSTESQDNSELSVWIKRSQGSANAQGEQVGAGDAEGKDQLR